MASASGGEVWGASEDGIPIEITSHRGKGVDGVEFLCAWAPLINSEFRVDYPPSWARLTGYEGLITAYLAQKRISGPRDDHPGPPAPPTNPTNPPDRTGLLQRFMEAASDGHGSLVSRLSEAMSSLAGCIQSAGDLYVEDAKHQGLSAKKKLAVIKQKMLYQYVPCEPLAWDMFAAVNLCEAETVQDRYIINTVQEMYHILGRLPISYQRKGTEWYAVVPCGTYSYEDESGSCALIKLTGTTYVVLTTDQEVRNVPRANVTITQPIYLRYATQNRAVMVQAARMNVTQEGKDALEDRCSGQPRVFSSTINAWMTKSLLTARYS